MELLKDPESLRRILAGSVCRPGPEEVCAGCYYDHRNFTREESRLVEWVWQNLIDKETRVERRHEGMLTMAAIFEAWLREAERG